MNVERFLKHIQSAREYRNQIVHIEALPERSPTFLDLPESLSPQVRNALQYNDISHFFAHQVEAIDHALAGRDITIATSTASGKTLCYLIPVLEALLEDPGSRFLFLFPTKALTQDQLRVFQQYLRYGFHLTAGSYDGDTPADLRRTLRDKGQMILTNPDMLHQGILPNHTRWSRFFSNLKYIVVDEIHTYRGVFGSNVANVLRRLNRICDHYGSRPTYVCCSATIANPKELGKKLTGRPMQLVQNDTSPKGPKQFVFWNPPPLDIEGVDRASSNMEGMYLLSELIRDRVQTIAFSKTRLGAEIIYRYAQERLQREGTGLAKAVRAYRGGYLPEERREIEKALSSGELLGVSSTNALELGIDIGSLDSCIIVGYPGTIASTWQQAGRAGRRDEESLTIFVAHNSPIDQFFIRNPQYFFGRSPENAIIDPYNPHILLAHLRCAAHELPIRKQDIRYFGEYMEAIMEMLEEDQQVRAIRGQWYWKKGTYPAADVGLRNMSTIIYTILDESKTPRVIGTIDEMAAFSQVHTHAIYLHNGETYFVNDLNTDQKIAHVEKQNVDYYTQSVAESRIQIDFEESHKQWKQNRISLGDVTVTQLVIMFKKIKFQDRNSIGFENLNLPPVTIDTTAFWLVPPQAAARQAQEFGRSVIDGLVGIANVLVEVIPVFTMCDPSDIGSAVDVSNLGVPTLFIYDRYAGGMGFAERAYELIAPILEGALRVIEECPCKYGCPSCVGSAMPPSAFSEVDAGTRDRIPDKEAALIVLHEMLGLPPYVPRYRPLRPVQPPKPAEPVEEPAPAKRLPMNVERKLRKRIRRYSGK